MRFIILLAAVAFAANERCDDLDGSTTGVGNDSDLFLLTSCNNGQKLLASLAVDCGGVACQPSNCCEDGVAGDASTALKGSQCPASLIVDFGDLCQTACTSGYEGGSATAACTAKTITDFTDANSSDANTAQTVTFGATTTVNCNVGWGNTNDGGASYTVTLDATGDNLAYTNGPCAAQACIVGGSDVGQQKGVTCANSGAAAGTGTTCSCNCDSVWFSDATCSTAATIRADAGTTDKTTATTVTSAAAETFTCSGTKLAALTGAAAGGTGGAASYTVSQDAAGVNTYTPLAGTAGTADVTCQEPITLYLWTGGDANSDLSGDQNLAGTAQTVTCDAGFAAGVKGAYVATYDITLTADDTFTTSPLNASCAAKVFDIPAQDIANTNFAAYDPTDADTDAIEITFEAGATPTGVAITCNTGYFGTDGKLVVDANGGVTEGTAASCTQCTADGASNTIPTANAVPANATGTAASWTCTQADASYFGAFTCNTGYTANAANTACEADATDAPTTTAAPVSSADDESAASPAFIAGTAIAGIALLL